MRLLQQSFYKQIWHEHMNCAHLEKATKFTCSFEGCHYSCFRPEDLLMHEKRHADPMFKAKQKNPTKSSKVAPKMQEASSSDTGYTQHEFVQALQQQLSQESNPDAFSTIDFSYFQDDPQVTKTLEPKKEEQELNTPPIPDQNLYQPPVSDISEPDVQTVDPKYQPGLLIYADNSGILKTDPNLLVPGMTYVCSDNFELVPSTSDKFKELSKDSTPDDSALTSFTISIKKNPGKNDATNGCPTQ